MTTEITIDETENFPDKPEFVDDANSLMKSFGSVIAYFAVYVFLFKMDVEKIFVLIGVLLLHELGHFLAMKYYGYRDVKMFFVPFMGAFVSGTKLKATAIERSVMILAGPGPGIIAGIVLLFWFADEGSPLLKYTVDTLIYLNVFNLLPFNPLDGGRLMETLFFSTKAALKATFYIISGVVMAFIAVYFEIYLLLIFPLFLPGYFIAQSKNRKIKQRLTEKGIDYNKEYEELTNKEYWQIRDQIIISNEQFNSVPLHTYKVSKFEKKLDALIQNLCLKSNDTSMSIPLKLLFATVWCITFIGAFVALIYAQLD